jgi:hypothetical protein
MGAYEPPVDQLLRIEEDLRGTSKQWHDYLGMGIGLEHVPDLIRMAVDEELNSAGPDSPEVWAPVHAWRALGVLRAEQAIPTLVGILANQSREKFDEWVNSEIPTVLGMIGPAALPEVTALLEREDASDYGRDDAARALFEIAKRHPEERSGVVATITRLLEQAENQDPGLNGFLVNYLLDLQAKESAEVIERAYAGGFVDEFMCGKWYDVWQELELEGEPPPDRGVLHPEAAHRVESTHPLQDSAELEAGRLQTPRRPQRSE